MTFLQCTECDRKEGECKCERPSFMKFLDKSDQKQTATKKSNVKKIFKVKGFVKNNLYAESVIIDDKAKFLAKDMESGKILIKDYVENGDIKYLPLEKDQYGYFPYTFSSSEIVKLVNKEIQTEHVLSEVKEVVDKYIVAKEIDKHLVLGDVLITYSQEWIHTIHFPFFVGETESGKSSVLHLGRWLTYRCLYGEDIPHADIYNFLGTDEEGNGTICEDEAQDIVADKAKLRTYKNSYSKGSRKARIIGVDSMNKKQVYYKTFCPKWFAGEKVPEDKGFKERLAVVFMTEGNPKSNIKRPTREEAQKLNDVRDELLVWKLQNMGQVFKRVDSKLENRDQELWEDFLTIVSGTKFYEKCQNVVNYYIQQRHEVIRNSMEARIFKLLCDKLTSNRELNFLEYWQFLTRNNQEFTGTLDERKINTFYPDDFGRSLTHNTLAKILEQKFRGEKRIKVIREDKKQKRVTFYSFNLEVLDTMSKKYGVNLSLDVFSSGQSGLPTKQGEDVDHVDDMGEVSK